MKKFSLVAFAVSCVVFAALTVVVAPAESVAQVFNLGTFIVDDDLDSGDIPLAIPSGTWTSYSLTTDWSALSGDPWSNEAIWAITDGPGSDPATTFFADPGAAPNSLASGDPVTLLWNGFFDIPLSNPPVSDGVLLTLQTFEGSTAEWANTVLTLGTDTPTLPTPRATFDLTASAMDMDIATLSPAEVAWYEIVHPGGQLTITTNFPETTLLGDFNPDLPDTELGLYNSLGGVIATNDDVDFPDNLTSEIVIDAPAGTYYVATGGFNTDFGGGFGASSTDSFGGDVKIAASVIPEPCSLTITLLVGFALSVVGFRQRRG